jgi:hypothetical protein
MTRPTLGRLRPGRRVILRSTGEKGVVVATWPDGDGHDCWVAFFGQEWPTGAGQPPKPYVLRYYDTSLAPADGQPFAPAGLAATFAGAPGAKSKKRGKKKRPRR